MTITGLLADLEAKAKQVKLEDSGFYYYDRVTSSWIPICSPDGLLMLVAYVRKVEAERDQYERMVSDRIDARDRP